ncbi:hypothetical protein NEMIN01_0602 [Nematocida minor]|uniref:uncharacterized protein n=1 Tax=Nematocida minor TaxID=1912983 RepID=UPI002220624A|nr:uncharacterized protein NEMIN01_0602 [Nematocida minor]KAI5189649.1 hypothetical protein NEMIN01_0602 [Nematocida minor]
MYAILTEDVLKEKKEVAVAGEILLEDDDIFMKGADGYRALLCFDDENESQRHDISEYEGETALVYGTVEPAGIKVVGHSAFKKPLDMDLFKSAIKEINSHPDLFCRDINAKEEI